MIKFDLEMIENYNVYLYFCNLIEMSDPMSYREYARLMGAREI